MNTTPLTPPAAPESTPAPAPAPRPGLRGAALGITLAAAIVGGIAIAGAVTTTAFAATRQFAADSAAQSMEVDAAGVRSLVVEASAGDVEVRFADVPHAQLEVTGGGRGPWEMRRDGDVLRVTAPRPFFGWWVGGWWADSVDVTVTLPEELGEGDLDAMLSVSAGELRATGDFRDLTLDVSAGLLVAEGSARSVDADVSAGRIEIRDLADAERLDLHVSAGRLDAVFTGRAPAETTVSVSAGNMDVTLPRGPYAVSSDVSAGGFDNLLSTDPASRNRVSVDVSAGGVTLRDSR